MIATGLILLIALPQRGKPITLHAPPTATPTGRPTLTATPHPIAVHIAGEVNQPGLYTLPADSRINDGIKAAGGLTDLADSNRINLAAYLSDGGRIYIPAIGEDVPNDVNLSMSLTNTSADSSFPININIATEDELISLPGIGSTKAKAIIEYRAEHGAFKDISELLNVPGIGPAIFDQIKDLITIEP
ncbi:MAG: helix-hairpin-helix domain-containing protein [Chloroflexota bacterium]